MSYPDPIRRPFALLSEVEDVWLRIAQEILPGETEEMCWYRLHECPHHYRHAAAGEPWGRRADVQLQRDSYPLHDAVHSLIEANVEAGRNWHDSLGQEGAHVVYELSAWDETQVYIGVTNFLGRRIAQHAKKWWWPTIDPWLCSFTEFASRSDALAWESEGIHDEQPAMNRAGRVLIPRYLEMGR